MEKEETKGEKLQRHGDILALPCSELKDHPLRLSFYSQGHLEALAASIRATGLLEAILVWKAEDGSYTILSGHYRVRAVRRLRRSRIPCRVMECDRHTAHVIYCTSNLMTRGLSALEEAHIITGLIAQEGYTQEEAAKLWGRSKSWVSRRIKLLTDLNPKIKQELEQGRLLPRLAQELSRLPQGNEQERVLSLIRRHHLNKDEAAALVDWWLSADPTARIQAEEAKVLPIERSAVNPRVRDYIPEERSLSLIHRCTKLLKEVMKYLKEHPGEADLSAKPGYRIFLATLEDCYRMRKGLGNGGIGG